MNIAAIQILRRIQHAIVTDCAEGDVLIAPIGLSLLPIAIDA